MKSAIIPSSYGVEVSKMPFLQCPGCDKTLEINVGVQTSWNRPDKGSNPIKLIGSAICRNCSTGIGFEIIDNVIVYVSGKSSYGKLNDVLAKDIKMLYTEAELCFQHGTPNASATMCRAAIELALVTAGVVGNNMFELIADAKNKGKLDEIEVGLAHSSRLITRGAIHRGEFVSLADIPSILSATVRILNKMAESTNP
jgi:hypothetical protein